MKKTFSSLLLILCISGAQAAIIKDSSTDIVLRTEIKDNQITLYKCQNSLIEETLNYELKCLDKALGEKSYDLDDLADKLDSMEKNNKYRFYGKLVFTVGAAVIGGNALKNLSFTPDRSSAIFVWTLGAALTGAPAFGLSYLFADVICGSDVDDKLESDKELVIELKSDMTVQQLIYDLSDAVL